MLVFSMVVKFLCLSVEWNKARENPGVISDSYTSMFRAKLSAHIYLRELDFVYVHVPPAFIRCPCRPRQVCQLLPPPVSSGLGPSNAGTLDLSFKMALKAAPRWRDSPSVNLFQEWDHCSS